MRISDWSSDVCSSDLAAGTDIGMKGADFGLRTAGKALRGVFSGNSDEIEAEIEAAAREVEAQARKICEHLSPMLETQQRLVEPLPEFKPYPPMDQPDTRSEERRVAQQGVRTGRTRRAP